MREIKIAINDSELQTIISRFEQIELASSMTNTGKALNYSAGFVRSLWQSWAMGGEVGKIKKINRPNPKLAQSIDIKVDGPLKRTVYTNDPEMNKIEEGSPEIDMKDPNSPWLRSRKTRVTIRDGKEEPYLIIPFTWKAHGSGMKNVVPPTILRLLKEMGEDGISRVTADERTTTRFEANRYGEMIPRAEYQWGRSVMPGEEQHTDENGELTGYDSGMVRMWDSAFTNEIHGTYMTFRILTTKTEKNAKKWIRKAVAGIDITKEIEELARPIVETYILKGIKADLTL